jgi:mannose-6-phosphate isomerase-like protein (cupin superfamily)
MPVQGYRKRGRKKVKRGDKMKKINIDEIPLEDSHGGVQKKKVLVRKEDNVGKLIFLNEVYLEPGKEFPLHDHLDLEEVFYIVEGNGIMKVGPEEEPVKEGDRIIVNVNEAHSMKNTGDKTIKFIAIGIRV